MIRRPPRSTQSRSSAASDVYKRQWYALGFFLLGGYRATRSFIFAQARPLVHPAQMGLAYGVAETFNALSMTLAPLLAGVLYTHAPVVVYPVSLGLVGVAIFLT